MDQEDKAAPSRPLREQEVALIAALLAVSDDDATRRIAKHQVADLADGGMGSIRFVADRARTLGRCAAEAKYLDGDGTVVSIVLNLDAAGDLFELDIWKVDFTPLLKYPTPADLLSA